MGNAPMPSCPYPNGIWQRDPNSSSPPPRWYTIPSTILSSKLDFDICESCYSQISSSPYTKVFQPSPPRYPEPDVLRCDFSIKWIRVAWLITHLKSLPATDLKLVETVSRAMEECFAKGEDCPGNENPQRQWYSLPITGTSGFSNGNPIPNWCICFFCVKVLESLCPSFKNQFRPMYFSEAGQEAVWGDNACIGGCDLGADTQRNFKYLDLLLDAHDASQDFYKTPNLTDFMTYVMKWSTVPECKKDDESSNTGVYYSMRQVPEFTVCQECYINVIESSGSTFPFEPLSDNMVWSCQLYSDRMRRVWTEASSNNDIQFLRQKANERKEKERQVRTQIKALNAQKAQAQAMALSYTKLSGSASLSAFTYGTTNWGRDLALNQSRGLSNEAVESAARSDQLTMQISGVLDEWKQVWE